MITRTFTFFTSLLLSPLATISAAEPDVIVYGATPGGFCAAIAAKQYVIVHKLTYATLRERLLAQKQIFDLPVLPALQAVESPQQLCNIL